jgi:poly(A) polymerase
MKLHVLFESAKEEAALDLIRRTIAGTPYEDNVHIAGGFVRDEIMGKPSKDIDRVIDKDNGGIEFAEWICNELGIYKKDSNPVVYPRFGTAMFTFRGITHLGQDLSDLDIECVMPRAEENVRPDDRKSIVVRKTSMKGDAFRRDLTINALYKNVSTGEILDPTGTGVKDIQQGILRTPTKADDTFGHPKFGDPLRMLRVLRFASRYGYDVDKSVIDAIKRNAIRLQKISNERIRDELVKMLLSPRPVQAIQMLMDTGLVDHVMPELKDLAGLEQGIYHDKDAFGHTMDVLGSTEPRLTLRLAALLHDISKAEAREAHPRKEYQFIGHEKMGEDKTAEILRRLKFPNDVIKRVSKLVGLHMGLRGGRKEGSSAKSLRKFARKCGTPENLKDALDLMRADFEAHPGATTDRFDQIEKQYEDIEVGGETVSAGQKIVSGRDIMQHFNVRQGPMIGTMLGYAQELYDDDPGIDKETILVKLGEKFNPNEEE